MYGRLAQLQERSPLRSVLRVACTAGCHYCCHLRVEVRPYEVFFSRHTFRSSFGEADSKRSGKIDATQLRR